MTVARRLKVLHQELAACTSCSEMIGPVVHGPAIETPVMLIGQAPGPHEGKHMRPFAWTAGKTLFKWFEEAMGANEATIRDRVYFAAVARCFPGKAKGGGDRRPNPTEIEACKRFLSREVKILRPTLVIPVGTLAIGEVMGHTGPLVEVVGQLRHVTYHGVPCDVIALPHPSGASTWHRVEPGKTLLTQALAKIAAHPAMKEVLALGETEGHPGQRGSKVPGDAPDDLVERNPRRTPRARSPGR